MELKISDSKDPETGKPMYTVAWSENLADGLITIVMTGKADNGTYTIYVENDHDSPVSVHINVVSYAREPDREPVTLTPTLIQKKIAPSNTDIVVIYAAFAQGEFPILFADLWAEVTFPLERNGTIMDTETVILTDDGKHDDVIANDGIYTGIFTNIFETGRYSIKVRANGDNGKAVVSKGHMLGIGELDDAEYEVVENAVHKEVWQTTQRRKRRNVRTTRDRREDEEEEYEYDYDENEEISNVDSTVAPIITLQTLPVSNQDKREYYKQLEVEKLARTTRTSAQDTERVTNMDTIIIDTDDSDLCDENFKHFDGFCYKMVLDKKLNHPEADAACQAVGAKLIDVRSLYVAEYFLKRLRNVIKDFWADAVNDEFVKYLPRLVDNSLRIQEIQALMNKAEKRMAIERRIRKEDEKNPLARMGSIRQFRQPIFERDMKWIYNNVTSNAQPPADFIKDFILQKYEKSIDFATLSQIEEATKVWKLNLPKKLDHFLSETFDFETFEAQSRFSRAKRDLITVSSPCRYKDDFNRYRKNRKFAICNSERNVICQKITPRNARKREISSCEATWSDFASNFASSEICYHQASNKHNFAEAEKYCKELGGSLLRINCENKEVFEIKEENLDSFWISNMETSSLNELKCTQALKKEQKEAENNEILNLPIRIGQSGQSRVLAKNAPFLTNQKSV
ncbi:unnamed protein product [Oikopleura dioica]|uniref:C-type lectin domain-containing protein n=1 Tax=Oikopleura dioica TaxID=34765 RepID=E4XMB5_OIKDI|nr:unnamed protein product [Oikopleura dioica]